MSLDKLHSQIDEEQDRIDQIDEVDDDQLNGEQTEAYFKKLDDYQARIKDSNFPAELKDKQAKLSLKLLKEVSGEALEQEHASFNQTLDHFNDSLDQLANKNLVRIEESETLWGLVKNKIGLNFKEDPQKFLAAINYIQKFRDEHGSIAKIQDTGKLKWEKTGGNKDQLEIGEYIDINIFEKAEFNEEVKEYVAASEEAVEAEAEQQKAELEVLLGEDPASEDLPSLDDLEVAIAERMAGDLENAESTHSGLLHFSDADEFQDFLSSLETDAEREELMEHILGNLDIEPPLTPQQEMRLEQVELLTHLYSTLVIELGEQSKTWAQEVASLSVEQEQIMDALATYEATLANDLPAAAEAIKADPNTTLESIMPDRIAKLRTVDDQTNGLAQSILGVWSNKIVDIDMSDPNSIEDLNKQRFAIMSFVRVTKNYDAARAIAEEALESEFAAAMEALSPERREELRAEATAEIQGQVNSMRDQWIEEGLTDEQIQIFQEVLIEEEANRLIKGEAIKLNFDPTELTGEKKAMWDIYQDAFNVKGDFFELTDEQWDTVKKEILINAPLIILSGGTASLIRAGVTRGTVAVAARIGINATRALEASRALRIGSGAAGLLVEGAAFEYSHSTLAYGLGIEEHHILELGAYEQVERVLWSTAALGLFHGVGSGIQKGAQRSATRAASKELGITSTTGMTKESMKLLEAEAAKIMAEPVRIAVQAAIAVNAEAGAMMLLAAAQEGVYKGNLDGFFNHFGEHVFHSYTAVLSLKAGGAVANPIQGRLKSSYEKFKAERRGERGPERGENLRVVEGPRLLTDRTAEAKEKINEASKENTEVVTELGDGIQLIERRIENNAEPERVIFDHPVAEQSRWERIGIQAHNAKRGLREAFDALTSLGSKLKKEKAEKPESESTKEAERVLEEGKREYNEASQNNQMAELTAKAQEIGQWVHKKGKDLTSAAADRSLQVLRELGSKVGELSVDGAVASVNFVLRIEQAVVSYKAKAEASRRERAEARRRAEEEVRRLEAEKLAEEKAALERTQAQIQKFETGFRSSIITLEGAGFISLNTISFRHGGKEFKFKSVENSQAVFAEVGRDGRINRSPEASRIEFKSAKEVLESGYVDLATFPTKQREALTKLGLNFEAAQMRRSKIEIGNNFPHLAEKVNGFLARKDLDRIFEGDLVAADRYLKELHELNLEVQASKDTRSEHMKKDVAERLQAMEAIVAREKATEEFIRELYPEGLDVAIDYNITQGQIGNCYFLTSIHAIRTQQPRLFKQTIMNRISKVGDGMYVVKINNREIFVNRDMIRRYQEHPDKPSSTSTFGDALLEYANASYQSQKIHARRGMTMFQHPVTKERAEEGGYTHQSLGDILGAEVAQGRNYAPMNLATARSLLNTMATSSIGPILTLSTPKFETAGTARGSTNYKDIQVFMDGKWQNMQVWGTHAYSVAGYNPRTEMVKIANPHDTSRPFEIHINQLPQTFQGFGYVTLKASASRMAMFADRLTGITHEGTVRDSIRSKLASENVYELCGAQNGNLSHLRKRIDAVVHTSSDPLVRRVLREELISIYHTERARQAA